MAFETEARCMLLVDYILNNGWNEERTKRSTTWKMPYRSYRDENQMFCDCTRNLSFLIYVICSPAVA